MNDHRSRSILILALAAVTAAALLLRILAIAEPLGIDQGLWASAVRGMSRGQLLYRDVWEQRPPGIYVVYLVGCWVLGWVPATIAWLDILAAAATTGLIFVLARRLTSALTGAVAAALFATLTMPAWLFRNGGFLERSVCETFIVICVGLAAWCALRYREHAASWAAFGAGLFVGAAFIFKPNAALYFPAIVIWMACYRPAATAGTRASIGRLILWALAGAAVIPVVTFAWLWKAGLLGDARVAIVDFNRFYVGQGATFGAMTLAYSKAIFLRMKTDPLWCAGSIGAVFAVGELLRRRRLEPLPALAVCWGAAAALVIYVNGIRLFNSYFIQALAPLSLMTAWALTRDAGSLIVGRATRAIVLVLMFLLMFVKSSYPAAVFEMARLDWNELRGTGNRTAYLERFGGYANNRGYSARANDELATYIAAHTTPDDRIYLFGVNAASVYFDTDRLTAHRFLRVNFYVPANFPAPEFQIGAVTADLMRQLPRYLIFETLHTQSEVGRQVDALREHPEVIRLLAGYRFDIQIEDFAVYQRVRISSGSNPEKSQ